MEKSECDTRERVNNEHAIEFFRPLEDEEEVEVEMEEESDLSMESEEDEDDDDVDPSFLLDESDDDSEPSDTSGGRGWRGRGQTRPRPCLTPWRTTEDTDTAPCVHRFLPQRPPGPQLNPQATYSARDLFSLYMSPSTLRTLAKNTNTHARSRKAMGKKFVWTDTDVTELQKMLGLHLYMSLVSLPTVSDYWKRDHILSVFLPSRVMPRNRFQTLLWNIHLSDPEEDKINNMKKGTPEYDHLFKMRPLIDEVGDACQAHYHPRRELTVHERMVATRARTDMTQCMEEGPTNGGIKLFVLADASNGYTLKFSVYVGRSGTIGEHGLAYDAVMKLTQPSYLGTGYHVYVDHFYTSPQLFRDLDGVKIGACGTYKHNGRGCPAEGENALTKRSDRGAIRWNREGPLLFVQWMDSQVVPICSTVHTVFSGDVVKRRVKQDGRWATKTIPCPTAIAAYNKHMGGVDRSDPLIQYHRNRKTWHWYKTLFLHLVDTASTNAYLLHREISDAQQRKPLSHKDFLVELVAQLCGVEVSGGVPRKRHAQHVPVPIAAVNVLRQKATQGRRVCRFCQVVRGKRLLTPWKCGSCDIALCLILDRNCFMEWHRSAVC